MKIKNYLAILTSIVLTISFSGCVQTESSDSYLALLIKNANSNAYNKSLGVGFSIGKSKVYEVAEGTFTLDAKGDSGKSIYMVKMNTSDSNITSQCYVKSATGITLNKGGNYSRGENESDFVKADCNGLENNDELRHCGFFKHNPVIDLGNIRVEETCSRELNASVEKTYNVDDKRDLYVFDSNNVFHLKKSTLYAKTEDVYVWVVDDFANPYTSNNTQGVVTKEIAEQYAQKMQDMYKYITNVYTELPSKVCYSSNGSMASAVTVAMDSKSDTGTKINVVITDCDFDNTRSSLSNGTVAFTTFIDLFASDSKNFDISETNVYSNIGNYFYLDNYWAVTKPEDCFTSLAHEFQHLLEFGKKMIEKNIQLLSTKEGRAYCEMMAMICEDMMQDYIGISDDSAPVARLPYFNNTYQLTGILNYDDTYKMSVYAHSYAFGAWMVRQFGGTKLIHEMANNNYSGMDCVVNAVNAVNGKNYSEYDIKLMYMQALLVETSEISESTMNKYAEEYLTYNGYKYPIKPIDLWKLDERLTKITSSTLYKYDGPNVLSSNQYFTIPAKGFTLHNIGVINENAESITLNIELGTFDSKGPQENSVNNSSDAENIRYFLFIQ